MTYLKKFFTSLFFIISFLLVLANALSYWKQLVADSNNQSIAVVGNDQNLISAKQGQVLAAETSNTSGGSKESFASEDFHMEQVNIGGDLATELSNLNNDMPPEISDVRSEVVMDKEDDEIKVLINWKTNKPAISRVSYGKSGETLGKEVKEDDYSYTHAVVLPDLDASSVYNYSIDAQDTQGNDKSSERFVIYTGAPRVSLIDVLENAAGKAFGWALRK